MKRREMQKQMAEVVIHVFVLDLFWRENILVYLIKSLWGSNCFGWQVVCIQDKSLIHLW